MGGVGEVILYSAVWLVAVAIMAAAWILDLASPRGTWISRLWTFTWVAFAAGFGYVWVTRVRTHDRVLAIDYVMPLVTLGIGIALVATAVREVRTRGSAIVHGRTPNNGIEQAASEACEDRKE